MALEDEPEEPAKAPGGFIESLLLRAGDVDVEEESYRQNFEEQLQFDQEEPYNPEDPAGEERPFEPGGDLAEEEAGWAGNWDSGDKKSEEEERPWKQGGSAGKAEFVWDGRWGRGHNRPKEYWPRERWPTEPWHDGHRHEEHRRKEYRHEGHWPMEHRREERWPEEHRREDQWRGEFRRQDQWRGEFQRRDHWQQESWHEGHWHDQEQRGPASWSLKRPLPPPSWRDEPPPRIRKFFGEPHREFMEELYDTGSYPRRPPFDLGSSSNFALPDPGFVVHAGGRKVPCRFYSEGRCRNGVLCPFSHSAEAMVPVPLEKKVAKECVFFERRRCTRGVSCPFAHGPQELFEIELVHSRQREENPRRCPIAPPAPSTEEA